MMGLGYPGGPIISKLASEYVPPIPSPFPQEEKGNSKTSSPLGGGPRRGLFPRVWLVKREFNFSFSGLKSSVKREVDKRIAEK